jgi:hypothetical protein
MISVIYVIPIVLSVLFKLKFHTRLLIKIESQNVAKF